uniref:Uncharacterized protein n=1 Tax=Rhizophora mucronata TaxID=61149 RepID=A0A2P2NM88_RHIMU
MFFVFLGECSFTCSLCQRWEDRSWLFCNFS